MSRELGCRIRDRSTSSLVEEYVLELYALVLSHPICTHQPRLKASTSSFPTGYVVRYYIYVPFVVKLPLRLAMKNNHTSKRIPDDVSQFFDREAQVDREEDVSDDEEEHELGK